MNRLIESRPETPDKWEDWPDEAIEIRLNVSSVAGHASELKALAEDLNEAAAAKFAAGKDDIAHFLRDELVPKLRRRERERRDQQVRLYEELGSIFDSAERHAPQGKDGEHEWLQVSDDTPRAGWVEGLCKCGKTLAWGKSQDEPTCPRASGQGRDGDG